MIKSFTGKNRFLANDWPCKVIYNGVEFSNVVCALIAAQTNNKENHIYIKNMTPNQSQRFSRLQPLRKDWLEVRDSILEDLVRQKFNNFDLKNKLLATDNEG